MNLYLDTEFNGFGGALLSIGIIADNGSCFYREVECQEPLTDWVKDNVVPVLDGCPEPIADVRRDLHSWLGQFTNPTIVVDWYTDAVHFFSLFQGCDHSESFDYPCTLALQNILYESKVPHNSLSDAMAIKEAYNRKAA